MKNMILVLCMGCLTCLGDWLGCLVGCLACLYGWLGCLVHGSVRQIEKREEKTHYRSFDWLSTRGLRYFRNRVLFLLQTSMRLSTTIFDLTLKRNASE